MSLGSAGNINPESDNLKSIYQFEFSHSGFLHLEDKINLDFKIVWLLLLLYAPLYVS